MSPSFSLKKHFIEKPHAKLLKFVEKWKICEYEYFVWCCCIIAESERHNGWFTATHITEILQIVQLKAVSQLGHLKMSWNG